MRRVYLLLLAFLCIATFVACNQRTPDQKHIDSDIANGKWELVDPVYNPVAVDLAETLPIPDTYNGKTLKELWDYAYQYYDGGRYPEGFNIDWAVAPIISPDGKTVAYVSNKNCIEVNGLSVFSLDIKTGKETMLLGSSDKYEYYNALFWVDNDTLICKKIYQNKNYILCDLDGSAKTIHLKGNDPNIVAWNGKYFVYEPEMISNTRYIASIENQKVHEKDIIQCTEGDLAVESAISPDGSKIALKIYTDKKSGARVFAIYDVETKKIFKINNPHIEGAAAIFAIDMKWPKQNAEVNFNISKNGVDHNELWRYVF
jgi:Tol biopolymer transport system component